MNRSLLLLTGSALLALALSAQTTAPVPVLHNQANLVMLDVIVTDRNGAPVHGLKMSDFLIQENHVSQTITSLEDHTSATVPLVTQPSILLPPGTFTNRPLAPPSAALNAILIDNLNTPIKDQPYLRDQLLAYLSKADPSTRIAVFTLNSRLHLIQGFISDPRILRQAILGGRADRSVMLTDEQEANTITETITQKFAEAGMLSWLPPKFVADMQNNEDRRRADQTIKRGLFTLDGLDLLAHYLAGFSGRKNVVWFSGSFPIDLYPALGSRDQSQLRDPFARSGSIAEQFRKTAELLTRSQVAVYPVDARGLMVSPVFSSASSSPNPDLDAEGEFNSDLVSEHQTMQQLADATGGRAFFNTNGFTEAVEKAVRDGNSFYTISYTPTNPSTKSTFRHLYVALTDSETRTLRYRHGYFAGPVLTGAIVSSAREEADPLKGHGRIDQASFDRVMEHAVPEPAQIIFKLDMRPATSQEESAIAAGNRVSLAGYDHANAPFRRYAVHFLADARGLTLIPHAEENSEALLEFMLVVYSADGRAVVSSIRQTQLVIHRSQIPILLQHGLDFQQEISVPVSGQYTLRAGLFDLNSSRSGALELPISLVSQLPPISNNPAVPLTIPGLKHHP